MVRGKRYEVWWVGSEQYMVSVCVVRGGGKKGGADDEKEWLVEDKYHRELGPGY